MSIEDVARAYEIAGEGGVYSGLTLHVLVRLASVTANEESLLTVRPELLANVLNEKQPSIHNALIELERDGVLTRATDPWGAPCHRLDFERLAALATQERTS